MALQPQSLMRLPCLTLSWTHWLFDLKSNNGCHSISFQLSALGFIFRKKKNASGCIFFKSPVFKSEPVCMVGLVTSSSCRKNFPFSINILKSYLSLYALFRAPYYKAFIFHNRCVTEKFIWKPVFGTSVLSECTGRVCQLKNRDNILKNLRNHPLL